MTTLAAVLGAVGALGVGGYVGSWKAHQLREKAARKREERECVGLLRLLLGEIELNTALVNSTLREGEEESTTAQITSRYLSFMKTETWQATRIRAAELVPKNLLQSLQDYYSPLTMLQTMLEAQGPGTDVGERWFRSVLVDALGEKKVALPPPVKQARNMLNAQALVRKQITAYLSSVSATNTNPS